tara:strand:- start:5445 stop:5957 length:513 start_codon:yes stop_codon:yes gene_type:complete
MKSKKNIVLIGMMGSGKSSIGKILSKKLNLEFIDIDSKIEEKENMTISQIFETKGEEYFRKLEEIISINNLKLQNKVISLGGGGYINKRIRKQTLKNCFSIWLDWSDEILINRIKKNNKRPLAIKLSINEIKKLIIDRSKIYKKSNLNIKCDNLDKNKIILKIIKFYENN